jgi:hypothetical protein
MMMDNRPKHIKKLIDTLVVPKVNEVLMEAEHPTIVNVEVDDIHPMGNRFGSVYISVMVHYKNPPNGLDTNIRYFYYPICHMITNCIDYVITDNYKVTIINILMDDLDSMTLHFDKGDSISTSDAMDELKNRLMVD